MKLIKKEKFNIIGRGDVFTVDLAENDLPQYRPELKELLLGKEVEIDNKKWLVRGLEMRGLPDHCKQFVIGVLVKEIYA